MRLLEYWKRRNERADYKRSYKREIWLEVRKRKALRWRITINYNTRYNELLDAGWLKSLIRGNKHLSLNHQIRTCRESRRKWRIDFRLYDSQLSLFPQRSIARRINRESSLLLVFTGGKTFFFFFFFQFPISVECLELTFEEESWEDSMSTPSCHFSKYRSVKDSRETRVAPPLNFSKDYRVPF